MAKAQGLEGQVNSKSAMISLLERRMGLSALSRKAAFTSSKITTATSKHWALLSTQPASLQQRIHLHPAQPRGKPIAPWSRRLAKHLSQRVGIKLPLLVSPERLFSIIDREAKVFVTEHDLT